MRNKGWIFTRHGTTVIGLKHVNAKANTYSDMVKVANLNASNGNLNVPMVEVANAA